MKYAIISDIHGNEQALEAVIKDSKKKGVKKYLCLGDIVGYGASPVECIEKIIEIQAVCIAGNHDHAVVDLTDSTFFNSNAKAAVEWSKKALKKKHKSFLKNLPMVKTIKEITMVHSSLDSPEAWRYILNDEDADRNMELFEGLICFIGHSHVPCIFQERHNSRALLDFLKTFTIKEKTIINVGSVGQPRDGDPRASYVIYDTTAKIVSFEKVKYDIKSAQKRIMNAKLPKVLSVRLEMGK